MKTIQTIVIEVHQGCVTGAYVTGRPQTWPRVFVVALDGAEHGESTKAEELQVTKLPRGFIFLSFGPTSANRKIAAENHSPTEKLPNVRPAPFAPMQGFATRRITTSQTRLQTWVMPPIGKDTTSANCCAWPSRIGRLNDE